MSRCRTKSRHSSIAVATSWCTSHTANDTLVSVMDTLVRVTDTLGSVVRTLASVMGTPWKHSSAK